MNTEAVTLDCRGLRCPAPILKLSRASRGDDRPSRLQVLADDGDFPTDLRAWCRSTGARLESLAEKEGFFVADIAFPTSGTAVEAPRAVEAPAPEAAPGVPVHEVDASGMRCPAPILAVAKAAKAASGPSVIRVKATDGDFPTDLEAWCRSTRSQLFSMTQGDGGFVALVGLNGLDELPAALRNGHAAKAPAPAPAAPAPAPAAPAASVGVDLDLRGEAPGMALVKVGQHSMMSSTFTFAAPASAALRKQLDA
ncbi:MAG: sulfurtransferase TusA family protein, partial [Myxococcales bacterium]|nr:sulfurtransferase TusA family protein [Myxococcales bacterium]